MAQSRIEIFEAMAREQPEEALVWYGLASEYTKLERWNEAATTLRQVIRINPDYTAAYQMLGTVLMSVGQPEEARRAWTNGIEAATRTGAWKARQHMEGLLAETNTDTAASGFCAE